MRVTLTANELRLAAIVAVLRNADSMGRGDRNRYDAARGSSWQIAIEGAAGELAVAKALGVYWSGVSTFNALDVGGVQVRTTEHARGCLILHPADADDQPFVLVVGHAPTFELRGWVYGREGKRPPFWQDPQGRDRWAYFVPQDQLRPIVDLLDVCEQQRGWSQALSEMGPPER